VGKLILPVAPQGFELQKNEECLFRLPPRRGDAEVRISLSLRKPPLLARQDWRAWRAQR